MFKQRISVADLSPAAREAALQNGAAVEEPGPVTLPVPIGGVMPAVGLFVKQARELGLSEQEVIRNVMLKETVDGEFTTTEDVAEAVLFFAGAKTNALTGQSLIVSHGWFME